MQKKVLNQKSNANIFVSASKLNDNSYLKAEPNSVP